MVVGVDAWRPSVVGRVCGAVVVPFHASRLMPAASCLPPPACRLLPAVSCLRSAGESQAGEAGDEQDGGPDQQAAVQAVDEGLAVVEQGAEDRDGHRATELAAGVEDSAGDA